MRDNRTFADAKEKRNSILGGFAPPQATEIEEVVLGAILIDKTSYSEVSEVLKPEVFYKDANQKVYEAIQEISFRNDPIDLLTVMAELKKTGNLEMVGGPYYLTQLTDRVASSANIESHARLLVEKYIMRELIRSCTDTIKRCYEGTEDVFDILSVTDFERDAMLNQIITKKEKTNAEVYEETVKRMIEIAEHKNGITGVPSGFFDLDEVTNGFQPSDLTIIAARPAMGKTAFFLSCALNAASRGHKPAVFSLEMSSTQLMNRQISWLTEIELNKVKKPSLLSDYEWKLVGEIRTKYEYTKPIKWDDTANMSIIELCAKARRMHRKYGIDIIFIDYLQLIGGKEKKNGNREQEIASISRALKGLAKELNIPVVALSQLSRKVEERGGTDKRPMLSDLRESGAIEQDADLIFFLYRPEYYGITEDAEGRPTTGMAEVIVGKNRHGETCSVALRFVGKYTKFLDFSEYFPEDAVPFAPEVKDFSAGIEPNNDFFINDKEPF